MTIKIPLSSIEEIRHAYCGSGAEIHLKGPYSEKLNGPDPNGINQCVYVHTDVTLFISGEYLLISI